MADTTQPVSYELAEQVRRLTEENERLRARVAVEESGPPREPREPRRVWRSVVVVVLMALATILAPAAVIAGWASVQLDGGMEKAIGNIETCFKVVSLDFL